MKFKPIHVLVLLPYMGIFVGLPLANRVTPYVLGMPFLLFWIAMWTVLSSLIAIIFYKFDHASEEGDLK